MRMSTDRWRQCSGLPKHAGGQNTRSDLPLAKGHGNRSARRPQSVQFTIIVLRPQ
jgi:hypothetical protein